MKKLIALGVAALFLSGCGDGSTHIERIDGVECMVRRDRINGRVRAMSCNWEDYNEERDGD